MLSITFNIDKVLQDLDDVGKKQAPFALALALNRTAEERQALMRERIVSSLSIRQPAAIRLFEQSVRFARADRADKNKGKFAATVRIIGRDTPAQQEGFRRFGQMILRHDEGGKRIAGQQIRVGRDSFPAFYIPARPRTQMERKDYPGNIGAAARRDPKGKLYHAKSKRKTRMMKGASVRGESYYTVKLPSGRGIIFKRFQFGNEMSKSQPIWWLRPSITLKPRLQLDRTFYDGLDAQLQANWDGFLTHALRTAWIQRTKR